MKQRNSIKIIKSYANSGTAIYTNLWKNYNQLEENNMLHIYDYKL